MTHLSRVNVWKGIDVFIAMLGIRLDSGKTLLLWMPLIGISLYISDIVVSKDLLVQYAAACWAFYYVGMTLILGTGIKRWMISRLGAARAWLSFQVILGLMFFNIGAGITAAALHRQEVFSLPPFVMWALVIPLFIIGYGAKYWATWVVGIDVYYYKDLFLETPGEEWVDSGPYRWLTNPMYGAGYLHSYCLAIMLGSVWGLGFAALCHLGIYGFFQIAEKPFIVRTYHTK